MDADHILEQLKDVGALGGPAKAPSIPATKVLEVDVEHGVPSAEMVDLRGEQTVEAIDSMLYHLDGLREALLKLRSVWQSEEESVDALEALETPETAVASAGSPEVPSAAPKAQEAAPAPTDDEYRRAREAAIRKIRGDDLPDGTFDDEEDVPFVGQVRALPAGQEPDEVTIRTVGTIKPSFPVEG